MIKKFWNSFSIEQKFLILSYTKGYLFRSFILIYSALFLYNLNSLIPNNIPFILFLFFLIFWTLNELSISGKYLKCIHKLEE